MAKSNSKSLKNEVAYKQYVRKWGPGNDMSQSNPGSHEVCKGEMFINFRNHM